MTDAPTRPAPLAVDDKQPDAEVIAALWQNIIEKDDRTSPAEYPDMALISFFELKECCETYAATEARKKIEALERERDCYDAGWVKANKRSVAQLEEITALKSQLALATAERDDARNRIEEFERGEAFAHTQERWDHFRAVAEHADLQLAAREAEVARLVKGLGLALARLIKYEPGDSRAVSDEFVAMFVLEARLEDYDNAMTIIEAKLAALAAPVAEKEEG